MASSQPQVKTEPTSDAQNIITALGKAFKGQNGAPLTGDQLALWLHQNMAQLGALAKEGKLTQGQILAVRKNTVDCLPLREFISVRNLTRGGRPCVSPLCVFVSIPPSADFCLSRDPFHGSSSKNLPTSTKPPAPTPQPRQLPLQSRQQQP